MKTGNTIYIDIENSSLQDQDVVIAGNDYTCDRDIKIHLCGTPTEIDNLIKKLEELKNKLLYL